MYLSDYIDELKEILKYIRLIENGIDYNESNYETREILEELANTRDILSDYLNE